MKHFWTAVLAIVAAVVPIVLIGLPLYVFPPVDEVHPSDAAFVLGPPMDQRLSLAERLRNEGVVSGIVVSVQPSDGQTADDIALCQESGVTCEVADPFTTRGEVRLAREYATGADAPSLIVVTSTPHVARARFLFAKCYPGEVAVVAAERPDSLLAWAFQYVYQSIAFVKAFVEPCPEEARG